MNRADGDAVRIAEWRRVRGFAAGARSRPAALVIAGEPGAGKSTLWRAGVAAAADAGHRVLRSEPAAAEADLPFTGLSDLLASVLPEVAADLPGPQRDALEVALLVRPAGDEPPAANVVGLAVLGALGSLAGGGPVTVAIDDAHWLDKASMDALVFAFRRAGAGPVTLVLAARDATPADPLALASPAPSQRWRELAAALPSETIELAPLDAEQIRRVLPPQVSTAHARVVVVHARGNPFWALQIAASLESADTPVPGLARTLTDRLARSLSAEAVEALAVVAAAGRITVTGVAGVLSHVGDPPAALDEAVLAGVVTETAGRLMPAHPLTGGAAVESLPPGRRRRLYQRLAAAADSPERRARFAALAAGPEPDAAVAAALDAAAESAHRRGGIAEAAQFAAQAVQATPVQATPAPGTHAQQRRIRAAELLFLAGDFRGSLDHAQELDLRELTIPDLERALPVLLDVTDVIHGGPAASEIIAGLARDPGADPRRRALVLSLAADFSYGIAGDRRSVAAKAISDAEAAGPSADASLHRALLYLAIAKIAAGDGLDGELFRRAEGLEARLGMDRQHDSANLHRGLWSRRVEDLDVARASLRRAIDTARDTGNEFMQALCLTHLAGAEVLVGDYSAGRALVAEADAVAVWLDWPPNLPARAEVRCDLLIAAGELEAARALADQAMPGGAGEPALSRYLGGVVRGKVSSWQADSASAVRWLEQAASAADECGFADPGVRRGLDTWLAEAYLAEGRPADALRIAGWLREIGQRLRRPVLTGNACRIEARAAALDGDLSAAADFARQAVSSHQAAPLRPELAQSLLVLGQIERRRRAWRAARDACTRARDLAAEMGHRPLQMLIERELPRVASARAAGDLTATERRVAELIGAGATNRDAAAALFIGVRTVETHVASIYRKLGLRNRAELGRWYSRHQDQEPAP